jgi:anti-sigma B factor antagonist
MDIRIREQGGATIVEVVGEITAATAPAAQAEVLAAVRPGGNMVLDMRQVSYMSSAGLRILLMTYRNITGKRGRVVLAGLPDTLKDTLGNVGFLDLLPHQDTLEAALAALTPPDGGPHGQ